MKISQWQHKLPTHLLNRGCRIYTDNETQYQPTSIVQKWQKQSTLREDNCSQLKEEAQRLLKATKDNFWNHRQEPRVLKLIPIWTLKAWVSQNKIVKVSKIWKMLLKEAKIVKKLSTTKQFHLIWSNIIQSVALKLLILKTPTRLRETERTDSYRFNLKQDKFRLVKWGGNSYKIHYLSGNTENNPTHQLLFKEAKVDQTQDSLYLPHFKPIHFLFVRKVHQILHFHQKIWKMLQQTKET